MEQLKYFRFWCQKVLPLVYDESLSYYEVLCKVVDYLNHMIKDTNTLIGQYNELANDLAVVQAWIDDFDTGLIEEVIAEYLQTAIFVGISDAGYIVYYIPETWKDITFNTTGIDIDIPGVDFGRLVLSY